MCHIFDLTLLLQSKMEKKKKVRYKEMLRFTGGVLYSCLVEMSLLVI